jgi:undecaprenyl-phosphate galactose phosphotransferase
VRNSASRDGAQTSEFGRDRTKISAGRAIIVELDGLSCALGVPQAPANSLPKRAFDIAGAIFLLLFLAPLLGLLAIAVFWDCGPVLSGHRRVGAGGRLFTCWKFRSMVVDAEAALARTLAVYPQALLDWERDYKLRSDPRVTPLGRFLRSSSLDELPQLFSVIIGDMSLIGPRPIAVGEIRRYGAAFRDYATCRPGITGLSQVSGRNATSYDARIAIDSQYARSWSFRGDLVILFRTVGVVLRRRGDQ